jgi:hypothetical protein
LSSSFSSVGYCTPLRLNRAGKSAATSTLISRVRPLYKPYGSSSIIGPLIRRTTTLSEAEALAFDNLDKMLAAADVKREGMTTTPIDLAVDRFLRTYRSTNPFDCIVDLATALEATLTGNDAETEAISLRLRSRAAALLSFDTDTSSAIFDDIGILYGLRSTLIHGGKLRESKFRKDVSKISTVPATSPFGTATAFAVDRMRDLVRRAFLARLCLASGNSPLWPFDESVRVDSTLADIEGRTAWRNQWRDKMAELGATDAANPARPGVDFISPDD